MELAEEHLSPAALIAQKGGNGQRGEGRGNKKEENKYKGIFAD